MKTAIRQSLGVLLCAAVALAPASVSAAAEDEVPTFTKDVAPIFQAKTPLPRCRWCRTRTLGPGRGPSRIV